ncbi:preprotein translocase subunit YajC [Carboxydochorda subterranea]|uniref:Preprotein translocase subunit YajC n=1 Tax=Carboxydichorda subterranea TaxID=3109565 RepID=A0ABZ1C0B2_9FIRM|nr:preprotein translocase subunit YajC [Limnochorda sp. L945t]WRP18290.1 preprotein translocase subunit YajC [Limnochorda sp. L945t]
MTPIWLAASQEQAQGSVLSLILFLVIPFVFFYLLLWRPQAQQQKRREQMLKGLKKGDRVVTVGGIHGEITAIKDDTLTVRIADKVEVRMSRSGVSHVKGKEEA